MAGCACTGFPAAFAAAEAAGAHLGITPSIGTFFGRNLKFLQGNQADFVEWPDPRIQRRLVNLVPHSGASSFDADGVRRL